MSAAFHFNPIRNARIVKWLYFPWLSFSAAGLFYFYQYLLFLSPDILPNSTALSYGQDGYRLFSLLTFYYYFYVPLQLLAGVLLDYYSVGKLLIAASMACVAGIFIFTLGHAFWEVEIGRALVVSGSAFAFVGALKLASIYFSCRRFACIVGLTLTFGMFGGITGQSILIFFLRHANVQMISYFLACAGLLIPVFLFFVGRQDKRLSESPVVRATSIKSGCRQLFGIMRNPQIWLVGLIGGLLYLPILSFVQLWGVPYLQYVHHLSTAASTQAVSLIFLGWLIGAPLIGWLSDKMHLRVLPLTIGAMLATIIMTAILYLPNLSNPVISVALFLLGVCTSTQISVFVIGREQSAENSVATTLATINMIVMLSGVICLFVIDHLLKFYSVESAINYSYIYADNGYQLALTILPVGLVIAAFLTYFVKEQQYLSHNIIH